MKKVAIFVEGYTEFYFMERLIQEVAGYGQVHLELAKQHAGKMNIFRSAGVPAEDASLYVLLINCCGDGSVKSFILERKNGLASQGFGSILGLQDLFPKALSELEKFEDAIKVGLEDEYVNIRMCIAVKEVEAWFLNEATHYQRIHEGLTIDEIREKLNFDPVNDNAETAVNHPAVLLDKIYKLAGLGYKKHDSEIKRLVAKLDYEELYSTVRGISRSLDQLLSSMETYFSPSEVEAEVAAN